MYTITVSENTEIFKISFSNNYVSSRFLHAMCTKKSTSACKIKFSLVEFKYYMKKRIIISVERTSTIQDDA